MGIEANEYDVQEDNKVLAHLESLPNYSSYVSDSSKKSIEYGFWTRPTISWSLECELSHPRENVITATSFYLEKESLGETTVLWVGSIAYGLGFLVTSVVFVLFCIGLCESEFLTHGCFMISSCCLYCTQFILFTITIFIVSDQQGELSRRDQAMKDLSFINECGDEFTKVPESFI